MGKRLIIINRMYAGKYITVGENIGHEIINLIRSDNGNNYLWLNADGNCDLSKFVDKKGKAYFDEIVMLMVRMYGPRQWKVLAKSEIDPATLADYMVPKFDKECHKIQLKKVQEENIRYGGQPVNKIFENNFYAGSFQTDIDIYFTFKAKDVYLPVCTPENMAKTVVNIKDLGGLANQSLRMYLTEDKNADTYNIFNAIANGEIFAWEAENTTQKVDKNATIQDEKECFLKIINEEHRELTYSNLLAYFLKNRKVMDGFARKVLQLNDFQADAYSIAREEKNIDLFISDPSHYIIIENKIRSGLIEETRPMEKKLQEYFNVKSVDQLPQKGKDLLAAFNNADSHFQTDRYYAYACGVVAQQQNNAQIKGYVLFPNYELHRITQQMGRTLFQENYQPITYKQVYDYFCTLEGSDILSPNEQKYLNEFLAAMEIQIKNVDNAFEEDMKNRFYKKIKTAGRYQRI